MVVERCKVVRAGKSRVGDARVRKVKVRVFRSEEDLGKKVEVYVELRTCRV